jgi:hypothetical protein
VTTPDEAFAKLEALLAPPAPAPVRQAGR